MLWVQNCYDLGSRKTCYNPLLAAPNCCKCAFYEDFGCRNCCKTDPKPQQPSTFGAKMAENVAKSPSLPRNAPTSPNLPKISLNCSNLPLLQLICREATDLRGLGSGHGRREKIQLTLHCYGAIMAQRLPSPERLDKNFTC